MRVGQQAFIGAGGYALFLLSTKFGVNPFLAVPLSVVVPVALAIPSYLLLGRLDGPYFAIGTWVLAEVLRLITTNTPYLNGDAGMSLSVMARYNQDQRQIALAFLCAALLLVALTAMRDDPVSAESQGVNVKRLRLVVFVLAAAGSGLAGSIYYMAQLRITPESGFDPDWSSVCIFIVMVGGIGRIEGPIIGALLYRATRWRPLRRRPSDIPATLRTNMRPLRGRAQRGQRIEAKAPHGRWQTTTLSGRLAPRSRRGSLAD